MPIAVADHRAVAWALMQRAEKRRRIDVRKNAAAPGERAVLGRGKPAGFWGKSSPFMAQQFRLVKYYKIYPDLWWMNGGYIMMFNDFKTIFIMIVYIMNGGYIIPMMFNDFS